MGPHAVEPKHQPLLPLSPAAVLVLLDLLSDTATARMHTSRLCGWGRGLSPPPPLCRLRSLLLTGSNCLILRGRLNETGNETIPQY